MVMSSPPKGLDEPVCRRPYIALECGGDQVSRRRSKQGWRLGGGGGGGGISKKIISSPEDQDLSVELPLKNSSKDGSEESGEHTTELKVEHDIDLSRRLADLTVPKKLRIYCLQKCRPIVVNYLMPRAVSIGPYHHGKSHLAKMDSHKDRFCKDFLLRNPGKSYKHYWNKLKELEPYLRKYYSSKLDLTCDQFIHTMLLDGCFILELLVKAHKRTLDKNFEDRSLLQYIKSDLLMFENQIPLMVLLKLHGPENMDSLPGIYQLLVNYFWDKSNGLPTLRTTKSHSLLHFYYLQFIPPHVDENRKSTNLKEHGSVKLHKEHSKRIPSALKLMKVGVTFRRKSSNNFLDITFHDGVLEMPFLSMDEPFLSFLVNLIMFEVHGYSYNRSVMQAYCSLMGCLLETAEDVVFLHKLGIIETGSMSEEELCNLFCQLQNPDYVMNQNHYFVNLFMDLLEFCENAEVRALDVPIVKNVLSCRNVWGLGLFLFGLAIAYLYGSSLSSQYFFLCVNIIILLCVVSIRTSSYSTRATPVSNLHICFNSCS